ncbi:hypothetical protein JAAARDRAFT_198639 [Jaapia argillacea MUCL 33604]|uniref:Uncharacterized protein n=1 Tax=Jaapia argillacea MUCL 33604 TaxID=933084 RepID=A0A067PAR0_9AGAM|nr:hypothetical protein JAAARDRAFT_198639 [Jaapia argillacea MUCL 33604]
MGVDNELEMGLEKRLEMGLEKEPEMDVNNEPKLRLEIDIRPRRRLLRSQQFTIQPQQAGSTLVQEPPLPHLPEFPTRPHRLTSFPLRHFRLYSLSGRSLGYTCLQRSTLKQSSALPTSDFRLSTTFAHSPSSALSHPLIHPSTFPVFRSYKDRFVDSNLFS